MNDAERYAMEENREEEMNNDKIEELQWFCFNGLPGFFNIYTSSVYYQNSFEIPTEK